MRLRRGTTDLAGVLLIDKPEGMTSHDVVAQLRKATGERRMGHAGTLDPMATGLLQVLVGRATRLEQYLVGHSKRYDARIVFGTATDTLDADGKATAEAPVPESVLDPTYAAEVLAGFVGVQEQLPPAYSAIKRAGVPAHRVARAGGDPALDPRLIEVYSATLRAVDADARAWDVTFAVSKGTYIRSLARDIGVACGTVSHLGALRRTCVGEADVSNAHPLDAAIQYAEAGDIASLFSDPVVLMGLPAVQVDPVAVSDGRAVDAPQSSIAEGSALALVTDDELLGVYRMHSGQYVCETLMVPGVQR